MEIYHFSHEHPLFLSEEKWNDNFHCNICGDVIFSLSYCCIICPYILHKWCAELPNELSFHSHHLPDHSLILSPPPQSSTPPRCKICNKQIKNSIFLYSCSTKECSYNLHVECASFPEPLISLPHYDHKFTFATWRPWRKDSYTCPVCNFPETKLMLLTEDPWEVYGRYIHIQCATLPQKVKHEVHLHELTLRPPLKENEWYFEFLCDACEKERDRFQQVYYCEPCEFVAQIGCGVFGSERPLHDILKTCPVYKWPPPLEKKTRKIEEEGTKEETIEVDEKVEDGEGEEVKAKHYFHKHPLVRFYSKRTKEAVCIVCSQSIFGMIYACMESDCKEIYFQDKFYLHKFCAQLPRMIQYSNHPNHGQLKLMPETTESFEHATGYNTPRCEFCGGSLENLYYACEKCDFRIHCLCLLLPNDLNHQSHEHTLTAVICSFEGFKVEPDLPYDMCKLSFGSRWRPLCRACRFHCEGLSLECESCDFHLHVYCFLLPYTGKHTTHRHDLSLTYTYKEDPTAFEYICDTCEKPRTPNCWVYCCPEPKCYIVSHVDCVVPKLLIPFEHHE